MPPRGLAVLGRGLARLHQLGAPAFGPSTDNFLATLPQRNTAMPTWSEFYVERRLRPLAELGLARGRMPDVRGGCTSCIHSPRTPSCSAAGTART